LLFGTKKLRNIGGDLGGAIKSFKKSVKDSDSEDADEEGEEKADDEGARTAGTGETLKEKEEATRTGDGSAKPS